MCSIQLHTKMTEKNFEKWGSSDSGFYQRTKEVTYLMLFYVLSLQFKVKSYRWDSCVQNINLRFSESFPKSHSIW